MVALAIRPGCEWITAGSGLRLVRGDAMTGTGSPVCLLNVERGELEAAELPDTIQENTL